MKVALAYSGGLDTSFCIPYLREQGYGVYTVTVDTGGFSTQELEGIAERAISLGAIEHRTIDGRSEVYNRFAAYIIKGNILRGQVYPICVGAERVVQAEKLVRLAQEIGAQAVCHGSSGAGNDQVRFDIAIRCVDPKLEIITPIRDLEISREDELSQLKAWGFEFPAQKKKYSINQGILGTTIGGGETHRAWESIPNEAYIASASVENAPDIAQEVLITFAQGLPTALDERTIDGCEILMALNELGSRHGIGRGVHTGDTVIGIKGRIAFEAPGMTILIQAHRELEKLVLTKWQHFLKEQISPLYGMLLHEGQWFNPVMRDIEACIDSTQLKVAGDVRLRLHKGGVWVDGMRSAYSLMHAGATYGEGAKLWSGAEARGFCHLSGLQSMLACARES